MIKFVTEGIDGVPLIGLGISAGNVKKLKEGQPILVRGKEIGRPEVGNIMIFYGKTEKDMTEQLRKAGWPVPPDVESQSLEVEDERPAKAS